MGVSFGVLVGVLLFHSSPREHLIYSVSFGVLLGVSAGGLLGWLRPRSGGCSGVKRCRCGAYQRGRWGNITIPPQL